MKKKVGELTISDIRKLCRKSKRCSACPLNNIYSIPCSLEYELITDKDLEKEVML